MGKRRHGFTREQHFAMGADMRRMDEALCRIWERVQYAYGKSSRQSKAALAAFKLHKQARSVLDDAICRESLDDDAIHAYYGMALEPRTPEAFEHDFSPAGYHKRFTKAEHFALGDELKIMNRTFMRWLREVADAYPLNSREMKTMERAYKAFCEIGNHLDNAICGELPRSDSSATYAYYGPHSSERAGVAVDLVDTPIA
jgi:hypothetical protein